MVLNYNLAFGPETLNLMDTNINGSTVVPSNINIIGLRFYNSCRTLCIAATNLSSYLSMILSTSNAAISFSQSHG